MGDLMKQLKIKVSVLKRVRKDLAFYTNEHQEFTAKVRAMEARGDDAHDIKQQRAVAEESANMIPDAQARIDKATADLQAFVDKNSTEAALQGEVMEEAKALTGEVEAAGGTVDDG